MTHCPVLLAPKGGRLELEPIAGDIAPSVTRIFACDAYVDGIEAGRPIPGLSAGFMKTLRVGGREVEVVNIDHHAPDPRAEREVSSGNLAIEWIGAHGQPDPTSSVVVINHTDCDSVVSAALMSGNVDAGLHREVLGRAVIDADHGSAELPLAELLQALDNERDFGLSLRSMLRHLERLPPEDRVGPLVDKRRADRTEFAALVRTRLRWRGSIAVLELDRPADGLDNAFFPALVPDAALCILASPVSAAPGSRLEIKLRHGPRAPHGLRLNRLPFDPDFGGRWNAGGNKRSGGTDMGLDDWLDRLELWMKSYPASSP